MSKFNIICDALSQKAHNEFTVEHIESEGVPIGVNGTRFVRIVFDGRYGNDVREKDKPKVTKWRDGMVLCERMNGETQFCGGRFSKIEAVNILRL